MHLSLGVLGVFLSFLSLLKCCYILCGIYELELLFGAVVHLVGWCTNASMTGNVIMLFSLSLFSIFTSILRNQVSTPEFIIDSSTIYDLGC
jgi:hypothetical protein